jgi:hypothetical protein
VRGFGLGAATRPVTVTRQRPRLLDLFCGAGGAAMGYHRAGFEVVMCGRGIPAGRVLVHLRHAPEARELRAPDPINPQGPKLPSNHLQSINQRICGLALQSSASGQASILQ